MADVGFIGLGVMGRPMAQHLLRGGHRLFIHTRKAPPPELLQAGASACDCARAVAERAATIILMLPNTADVRSVLFGPDGLAVALERGKLVIDMSSIAPGATREFARKVTDAGAEYLDAPVSGGETGAKAGTLTIMVGGPQVSFDRARPLFELMGKNITLIGDHGAGQTAKVANQIIVALTIAAVSEALMFASKAGADPARVRAALMGGFASSRILEVHGERMLKRQFAPGFRIALHRKDLALALEGANELGMPLPQTAQCQQLLNGLLASGDGALDHSALVHIYERLAAHQLGSGNLAHQGSGVPS
ncbi:MAG TPA: 2-hydroxy-3-oxopropionate reductase [Steroidobacteraceae bacterium]|nr:2-hydroxy-3-oxopropionate reductase [Steroidobacteraceae bacterium]